MEIKNKDLLSDFLEHERCFVRCIAYCVDVKLFHGLYIGGELGIAPSVPSLSNISSLYNGGETLEFFQVPQPLYARARNFSKSHSNLYIGCPTQHERQSSSLPTSYNVQSEVGISGNLTRLFCRECSIQEKKLKTLFFQAFIEKKTRLQFKSQVNLPKSGLSMSFNYETRY